MKTLEAQIAALFKPWIVKRPNGGCMILFPLSELDGLIDAILRIAKGTK